MRRRGIMPMSVVITALVLLLVAFLLKDSFRTPNRIVLPPEQAVKDETEQGGTEESVHRVSVRPDTVQLAVATLDRATSYSRTIVVERFWDGGSGISSTQVSCHGGWLRMDTTLPGGSIRRVITGEGQSYVWYDNERSYYVAADVIGEDAEQGILTYEAVLDLPVERIALADYRELDGINCIYVETTQSDDGYLERYWIDVASGLLAAAEIAYDGTLVYRMNGTLPDNSTIAANAFTLPDGTVLYEIGSGAG